MEALGALKSDLTRGKAVAFLEHTAVMRAIEKLYVATLSEVAFSLDGARR